MNKIFTFLFIGMNNLINLAISDNDQSFRESAELELAYLTDSLGQEEFKLLLSGEYDKRSAIVTIQAGAGGTDSQDWAEMLFNMYAKWGQLHKRAVQVLNVSYGEDAGYRTVTVQVEGLSLIHISEHTRRYAI